MCLGSNIVTNLKQITSAYEELEQHRDLLLLAILHLKSYSNADLTSKNQFLKHNKILARHFDK